MTLNENLNYDIVASNILFYETLKDVLDSLHQAGVRTIVLKGAALAETVYAHIGQRQLSDIDLLIKESDLIATEKLLRRLDYQPIKGSQFFYEKEGKSNPAIDIHTKLDFLNLIPVAEVWQRAQTAKIAGTDTLIMCPEDMLLYQVSHFLYNHGYLLSKWAEDISRLISCYQQSLDWKTILYRARKWHLEIPLYFTLREVAKKFRPPIPESILPELKPAQKNTVLGKTLEVIFRRDSPLPAIDYLLPLIACPGLLSKIKFALSFTFPSRTFLIRRYAPTHPCLVYLYYLIRPINLFLKAMKAIRYLIMR